MRRITGGQRSNACSAALPQSARYCFHRRTAISTRRCSPTGYCAISWRCACKRSCINNYGASSLAADAGLPFHSVFWLALITLVVVTAAMFVLVRGNRSMHFLRDTTATLPAQPPRVSLIIAARNEERNIETALQSLLVQDYPGYEVIVVDDRSTDATPQILARA